MMIMGIKIVVGMVSLKDFSPPEMLYNLIMGNFKKR